MSFSSERKNLQSADPLDGVFLFRQSTNLVYTLHMGNLKFAIVATDILLMRRNGAIVEVALKSVHRPPHYVNIDAFIGGIVHPTETGEHAARRIISEKTNLNPAHVSLTPLKFYDRIDRDKRGRVISIAYIGIIDKGLATEEGVRWVPLSKLPRLAYDHNEMHGDMLVFMKNHLFITSIALHFLPKEFTIAELKILYEYLLGREIDKRNFYKFVEELPIQATNRLTGTGRGRPAKLYKKLVTRGFFITR